MQNLLEHLTSSISAFDIIYLIITLLTVIQCTKKGFVLSLLSASKWLLALIITIILVPKLRPWAKNYIDSEYLLDIGLGIVIFICTIFIILMISRAIGQVVKYSGLGSVDSFFGLIFGIFKGYVICVCIFSLLNWFYPHQNWPVKAEGTYSFEIIYKGSELLIEEFPNSKDYYKEIEKV